MGPADSLARRVFSNPCISLPPSFKPALSVVRLKEPRMRVAPVAVLSLCLLSLIPLFRMEQISLLRGILRLHWPWPAAPTLPYVWVHLRVAPALSHRVSNMLVSYSVISTINNGVHTIAGTWICASSKLLDLAEYTVSRSTRLLQ